MRIQVNCKMKGECGDTPMQECVAFEEENVCLLSQGKRS